MSTTEKERLLRIEDFIALSREGKEVRLKVNLKKQLMTQKVHPEETEEMRSEIDMYLLIGDFVFTIDDQSHTVSKVYVLGSAGEPSDALKVNKSIANERLKMDYKRLKEAGITFEEEFF